MATLAAEAIVQAINDTLHAAHGSARTITTGAYVGGVYDSLEANAKALRSVGTPSTSARIVKASPHPASPMGPGTVILYALDIEVLVSRSESMEHEVVTAERDRLMSLAAADGSVLAQALGYPGNLTSTAAAAATGLVSGLIKWTGSSVASIADKTVQTTHTFTGVANVAP